MISAITDMGPIQDLKGVQRITGCLAALSRFIARLGECSFVGDRPRGPLKQWGNPYLNSCINVS
jgi:hypothetical protein